MEILQWEPAYAGNVRIRSFAGALRRCNIEKELMSRNIFAKRALLSKSMVSLFSQQIADILCKLKGF